MYIPEFWCGVVIGAGGVLLALGVAALVQQVREGREARRMRVRIMDEVRLREIEDNPPQGGAN